MALLELKDIGKIYVSEGAVSVGIRGVNLSFERGEFVAITGQSGSGKSTLLNVISGMDSYEEGELYIEGEQTSHYVQADWEKYREKYISFIFQEYNIIDSFTVLENVELALMHIEDKKERRAKALELIKRVGLEAHIKHKGSHLSGGQKQRTVIARALAKDSPIILADEPTGNLDSNTSDEIIALLKEVSKDKLLIVVTHNFEEVEAHATREIRVFDGAVASDRIMSENKNVSGSEVINDTSTMEHKHKTAKNSLNLGWSIFKSMPRLSVFLCVLMLVAGFVVYFAFASFWTDIKVLFVNQNYMFYNPGGRVVIAKEDGTALTAADREDIKTYAQKSGAEKVYFVDAAYDSSMGTNWKEYCSEFDIWNMNWGMPFNFVTCVDYGNLDYGRYPEKPYEAVIAVPYYMNSTINENSLDSMKISYEPFEFTVVGIHYYLDSDIKGQLLVSEENFKEVGVINYFTSYGDLVLSTEGAAFGRVIFDSKLPVGEYHTYKKELETLLQADKLELARLLTDGQYKTGITIDKNILIADLENHQNGLLVVNYETLKDSLIEYVENNYRQVSVIYPSDSKAKAEANIFESHGYKVVLPNETYKVYTYFEVLEIIMMGVMFLGLWILIIIFSSFFIRICTKKSMDAFKSDIAIMRSMGIRVNEIKAAVYFRIYVCIIPAIIAIPILSNIIIKTDFGGRNLSYLHLFEYVCIISLLVIVVTRVAKQHVAHLFSENVRKALKGDEN